MTLSLDAELVLLDQVEAEVFEGVHGYSVQFQFTHEWQDVAVKMVLVFAL